MRQLETAGVPLHFLGASGLRDLPRTWGRLTDVLRATRPVILQTFLFHANMLGRLAARRAKVPHVCCGIRVAERGKRWHLGLDRLSSGLVESYVCVSQSVADFSVAQGGLAREKLAVIPNGINVARLGMPALANEALGIPPNRRLIASVGRLDEQKRLDWLLNLAPEFLAALPEHDLVIVGDGPMAGKLHAMSAKSQFGARIHLVGWRPDVPAVLRASDLFVLPSNWEGMPNALLEAMGCGKPVVCTDVEGVREVLGDDEVQIIPVDNPRSFLRKVIELASHPDQAQELGARNRRRVEAAYTLDRMVSGYCQLYEGLLGGKN